MAEVASGDIISRDLHFSQLPTGADSLDMEYRLTAASDARYRIGLRRPWRSVRGEMSCSQLFNAARRGFFTISPSGDAPVTQRHMGAGETAQQCG
ncbi:hypothetical protein CKO25_14790 [Thiocapsa imhoffii]|uniref:Uncharacterized protein n=1 Tax=Thiocapsa imhoffii TaxID=382777 RepID=A0A9X1BAA9_9GAMM|nr:hypothetical protein [Thiocapsa imhoffii]